MICLVIDIITPSHSVGASKLTEAGLYNEILLIHVGGPSGSNTNAMTQGFFEVWDHYSSRSTIYIEYREADRYPGKENDDQFVKRLAEKYAGKKFVTVVSTQPGNTALAARVREALDLQCPLVAVEFDMPGTSLLQYENQYTLLGSLQFDRTLTMAKTLQPNLRRVMVIAGKVWYDRLKLKEYTQAMLQGKLGNTELIFSPGDNIDETVRIISSFTEEDALIFVDPRADKQGRRFNEKYWSTLLEQRSKAPAYSVLDTIQPNQGGYGEGGAFVGGAILEMESLGEELARLVVKILEGQAPNERVTSFQNHKLIYDYNGLKRFGYLSQKLPDEAMSLR